MQSPVSHPIHPLPQRRHALGLGCRRGTAAEEMWALVCEALSGAGIAAETIACVATIAGKADEPAIAGTASRLGVPLRLFSVQELAAQAPRLASPSRMVGALTGAPGICEAAALAVGGALVLPKRKSAGCTLAVSRF